MDDSVCKEENIDSEGIKDNPDLNGENAPVVDSRRQSLDTDDTSSSVNVQDAVQNVQEDLHVAVSHRPDDGRSDGPAVPGVSDGGLTSYPTDIDNDNGNLLEEEMKGSS
jgi:hypothetical protein